MLKNSHLLESWFVAFMVFIFMLLLACIIGA